MRCRVILSFVDYVAYAEFILKKKKIRNEMCALLLIKFLRTKVVFNSLLSVG
jgi:hypothetical protein